LSRPLSSPNITSPSPNLGNREISDDPIIHESMRGLFGLKTDEDELVAGQESMLVKDNEDIAGIES